MRRSDPPQIYATLPPEVEDTPPVDDGPVIQEPEE